MKLLHNGKIYTMDNGRPKATGLLIDRDHILAVGDGGQLSSDLQHLKNWITKIDGLEVVDLQGRTVTPGLTDAHIHLEQYALGLAKVDCETDTKEECLRRVVEAASKTPPGAWILGHGWNQNNWVEGFGAAADLDQVAPGHPVYLTAKSLHAGWANTAALRLADLTQDSTDPDGGRIGKDKRGEPDGILFESAMELVERAIPEPTLEEVIQAVRAALPILWRMGITGVHDFDRRRCFIALQELHRRGELKLRVLKSIPLEELEAAAELGLRGGFGDHFLRIGGVKAFADGALGPQTAAMIQPYANDPQNRGMLLLDAEELYERGRVAVGNGLSLAVHAIGDLAVHEVLEAFAQLRAYEKQLASQIAGNAPLRHRIEHVQVIHPDDADRLAALGVIASMQPIHATSDMLMADRYWGERAALSYAWRTQLSSGAMLAFGSDAPVESPNPFWGLHAAVTRQRVDGSPGLQGWIPEQRLSLEDAFRAYTNGPAFSAGQEGYLGRLAPGYAADLIVLDEDPFLCSADRLRTLQPAATMIAGEWVFGGA